jgi:hypothetical protein
MDGQDEISSRTNCFRILILDTSQGEIIMVSLHQDSFFLSQNIGNLDEEIKKALFFV